MGATDGPQKGVPHSVIMVILPFGQVVRRHYILELDGNVRAGACRPIVIQLCDHFEQVNRFRWCFRVEDCCLRAMLW